MGSLRPSGTALAGAVLACSALLGAPGAAHARETDPGATAAAPDVDRARAAYDRGVRANAIGDHAGAARAFAAADALAPQTASLEAALESAMKADDALLGAELVDRADGRAPDAGLRKTLEAARRRFAGRTGKIAVACKGEARCLAAVDGAAADARRPIYVAAGPHAVVVQQGEERVERLVEVRPDQLVTVTPAGTTQAAARPSSGPSNAAGASSTTTPAEKNGISPGWFVLGAAVTAIAGGITVASGLDAVNKHDRFVDDGCGSGGTGPRPADCDSRGSSGESAQLRTNVLLGATAVLAVTTVAIGVFAVRWKDGSQARMTVGTSHGTAMAGLELVMP